VAWNEGKVKEGKVKATQAVADGRFIRFGFGPVRTSNWTIGPVLPWALTLDRTTARFGRVQAYHRRRGANR
jgi:hypothetical protein